jgi:hypothetical protein
MLAKGAGTEAPASARSEGGQSERYAARRGKSGAGFTTCINS